jgi:hypothetical protein
MLSGIVGFTLLNVLTVRAADLTPVTKAPALTIPLPAVDGYNWKVDAFGGSVGKKAVYGAEGSFDIPLQSQFGAQLDGRAGSLDGTGFGSIGGHMFWRDPRQALVGIYGDYTDWNRFGGVRVAHLAGEGAYYFGQLTLEGIAGIEFGNSASSSSVFGATASATGAPFSSTVTTLAPVGTTPGILTTTTTTVTTATTTIAILTESYAIKTRFFDQLNLAYYPIDNWKAYIGHRYLGGLNALALGSEYGLPLGRGIMGSAFVEARVGEQNFHGIWGGLKLYFGQSDKPLIARQRRDDPPVWSGDSLFSILNNHATSTSTGSSQSSTSSSTSSQQKFCNASSEFPILIGNVCSGGS